MPRTILMHLNITPDEGDGRNADEVGDFILAALEVGLEGAPGDLASGNDVPLQGLRVSCPLVEDIGEPSGDTFESADGAKRCSRCHLTLDLCSCRRASALEHEAGGGGDRVAGDD